MYDGSIHSGKQTIRFYSHIYYQFLVILILSFCSGKALDTSVPVSTESSFPVYTSTSRGLYFSTIDDFDVPMALIPAGDFRMGTVNSDVNTQPQHTVYLDAFYIDLTEVTNYQYAQCVQSGVCKQPLDESSASRPLYYGNPEFNDYPVIYVTWEMASDYCEWRNARLPTEAEWEKAARGGSENKSYPWGDQDADCSIANFLSKDGFCIGDTTRVASYPPNGYGLFDMAGNLWEWVADCYRSDYYRNSPDANPQGPSCTDERVLRGGSWNDSQKFIQLATRYRYPPDHRGFGLNLFGIRCARSY
jgi:formylglycine-generating enzyme required for sulfatase activity